MTFRFIDRIVDYKAHRFVHAYKLCTRNESWFYQLPSGEQVLSPAVVSEAIAQASGWLAMASYDFKKRPILLADEETEYFDVVRPGDCLEIYTIVTREEEGDDMMHTQSVARVNGRMVCRSDCTRGYLLPLEELADPALMRMHFAHVYKPGPIPQSSPAPALRSPEQEFTPGGLGLIDGLLSVEPGKKVVSYKNVTVSENYFAEHFPRRPVVPGVVLMSCVGESCQYLLTEPGQNTVLSRRLSLVPLATHGIRFRRFVEPGDQCRIEVSVVQGDVKQPGSTITIAATIHANGARVMMAKMSMYVLGEDTEVLRTQQFERALKYQNEVMQPGSSVPIAEATGAL